MTGQERTLVYIGTGPEQRRPLYDLTHEQYVIAKQLATEGLVRVVLDAPSPYVETTEAGHRRVGELGGFPQLTSEA